MLVMYARCCWWLVELIVDAWCWKWLKSWHARSWMVFCRRSECRIGMERHMKHLNCRREEGWESWCMFVDVVLADRYWECLRCNNPFNRSLLSHLHSSISQAQKSLRLFDCPLYLCVLCLVYFTMHLTSCRTPLPFTLSSKFNLGLIHFSFVVLWY